MVWKFAVSEYCDNVGLTNQNDMARFTVGLLSGKACIWWMDWSKTTPGDLQNLQYDDFMLEMEDKFQDVDRERRLQLKFAQLMQKGSVQTYCDAFRHVRLQLGDSVVTDSNALFQFVEGLKPHIRKDVLLS